MTSHHVLSSSDPLYAAWAVAEAGLESHPDLVRLAVLLSEQSYQAEDAPETGRQQRPAFDEADKEYYVPPDPKARSSNSVREDILQEIHQGNGAAANAAVESQLTEVINLLQGMATRLEHMEQRQESMEGRQTMIEETFGSSATKGNDIV